MEVKNVDINSIEPYKNNPRNNDDAVDATANSIKEFDWQQPIVVDKDGVIIVGHTRLKAAKKLGLKQVPIVVAENLSDEKVKAYRLADNKTGEQATWNFSLLDDELADIDNIDMAQFGFSEDKDDEEPVDLSDSLDEKYQVVINCKDENELQSAFEKLQKEGYDCNILT